MENAQVKLANKRLCEIEKMNEEKNKWFENCDKIIGRRRIVELVLLASELWCLKCDLPLSLRHVIAESRSGLASNITVKCTKCGGLKVVHTNKVMPQNDANLDGHTYSINLKAVIGMLDAGMGETHMNTLFSALNIPPINAPVLKRHERVVGLVAEDLAKQSCRETIQLEKNLTLQKEV